MWIVFIGPESDHWLPLSLTDWLRHSCQVDFIDVALACEGASSKLVDVDAEKCVDDSLVQVWMLKFGHKVKFSLWCDLNKLLRQAELNSTLGPRVELRASGLLCIWQCLGLKLHNWALHSIGLTLISFCVHTVINWEVQKAHPWLIVFLLSLSHVGVNDDLLCDSIFVECLVNL